MGSGASTPRTVGVVAAVQTASQSELHDFIEGLPEEEKQKLKNSLAALSTPTRRSLAPEKLNSASDLMQQLVEKKVSCIKLVEDSLARIAATEELKACIEIYGDEARAKAKVVDEKLASGTPLGPLEGLPIVVKLNFDIAGTLTDASNPVLKGWRPNSTSPVIQALLDAGAIVVAKTNMPEMARNTNSISPLHGKCINPVNLANTPAGSSSGTAAAVAAGIVSAGIGSDTGGSCRLPAICTGIVGFRPSPGRYANDGCIPCVGPCDTPGPLCTSVRDIMLIDSVVTGTKHDVKEGSAVTEMLKGIRIAAPPDWIAEDQFVNKTVKVAWDASTGALSDKGVEFVKENMGEEMFMKQAHTNFFKSSWAELEAYLEPHRKSGSEHEMLKLSTMDWVMKSPPDEHKVFRPPNEDPEKAKAEAAGLEAMVKAAEEAIAGYFEKTKTRFILTPGMVALPLNVEKAVIDENCKVTGQRIVAEKMSDEEASPSLIMRYGSRWAGFLTSIAIPTPVKCQATGLPTGVILWGPKDSDQELLQAAAAVEATFATIDVSKHVISY